MYEELLISGSEEPTENKKIFKSNEDFIKWDELLNKISILEDAVLDHDHNHILGLLIENVEGFNRSNFLINE